MEIEEGEEGLMALGNDVMRATAAMVAHAAMIQ